MAHTVAPPGQGNHFVTCMLLRFDYGGLGRFCSALFLLSINTLRRTIYNWIRMLHYDMNYVNISSEIRIGIKREFRNCNFSHIFFNWNNSLFNGPTLVKFGTCIVKTHSGGTVSQTF